MKIIPQKLKEALQPFLLKWKSYYRSILIPGSAGIPLYLVMRIFFKGVFNGVITYRASAIAFNFFLALIPFVLFVFTLIPFMTSLHYQDYLMDMISELIPSNIYLLVKSTIEGVVTRPNQKLLSIVFFTAIYFATNGVDAIIEGFNQSYHQPVSRPWWKQKIVAFFLMIILAILTFVSVSLLAFGELMIKELAVNKIITSSLSILALQAIRWLIILMAAMFSTSILYYFGQLKILTSIKYKFITVGSLFATFLFLGGGMLLKLYFENFSRYNLLYGSLGSLILLLIWIYYNSLIILIGFEMDYSTKIIREKMGLRKKLKGEMDEDDKL